MGATSTPNLGMLLSLGQISGLVDDFTFYVYHDVKYGDKFDRLIRFLWNLTNEKWVPSQLSSFYYTIQDGYNDRVNVTETRLIPQPWLDLNEGSAFALTTRDFWIGSIPWATIIFLFFHCIYQLLAHFGFKFSAKLLNFRWFSILLFSILAQNLQVLSFRTFQQVFYGGPPSIQQFSRLYIVNQVACFLTFFFVITCACAGHYILRIFIGINVEFAL